MPKSPFALAWLGVEGAMRVRAGRLRAVDRPENRAAVVVLLLYVACSSPFRRWIARFTAW